MIKYWPPFKALYNFNAINITLGLPYIRISPDHGTQHCLKHIARFKRPKHYVTVSELPKNNYGKVLKTVLRETLSKISGVDSDNLSLGFFIKPIKHRSFYL